MSRVDTITFGRSVRLWTWDLRLTVQHYEKQPVWQAILKLAEENSGRTSQKMVHEQLLRERLPILSAKLLLGRVVDLGLLNEDYRLTDEGREALKMDRVPLTLTGLFTTTFVDDPLIPQVIVSVSKPIEGRVEKDALGRMGPARSESKNARPVPELLQDVVGRRMLVNETPEELLVKEIEPYGTPGPESTAHLDLVVSPENQTLLRIKGQLNRTMPLPDGLDLNYDRALDILLKGLGDSWHPKSRIVTVRFEDTSPPERRGFQRSFTIPNPEIPGFGVFDNVQTPPLKIEPRTSSDAQAWFDWLLVEEMPNKYMQASAFLEHVSRSEARLPERFRLERPSQESLAQKLFREGNSTRAWLLQAPLDLRLGDEQ